VSIHYPSKPSEERKRRKSAFAKISSGAAGPRPSLVSPRPDDRARRLAELSAVLADAVPAFQARARHAEEGRS
jgi:hypothetical protein